MVELIDDCCIGLQYFTGVHVIRPYLVLPNAILRALFFSASEHPTDHKLCMENFIFLLL